MKTTLHRCLLLSLIPALSGIAPGEPAAEPASVQTMPATKGTAASWRASEVVGTEVQNARGENIGKVEDLILDLNSQEILGAVISAGGFLGLGDTLTAVPCSALRYDTASKAFKTKLTKEQLGKAPQHKSGTWEENKGTVMEKLRDFQVSLGGDTSAPDNTDRNAEVVKDKEKTAMDQGNSESDLKTTKDIRVALVSSDLSFNAKNLKIITAGGKVTLKGVVESDAERKAVLDLATPYVKADLISDELEIKKAN